VYILVMLTFPAAADTTWWHTRDAAVIGRTHICSLYIYNNVQAVVISWDENGAETLAFQDRRQFHFADNEPVVVTIHIDNTLLSADIGYGDHDLVIVPIQQIDDLLPTVNEISATLATAAMDSIDITMAVNTEKMPTLLSALSKCRAAMK
jgi:hypothetical protein